MERRRFLQVCSAAGLTGLTLSQARSGGAQSGAFEGPFWVFVHANGGWDPQFLFDPTTVAEHNRYYGAPGRVGNISHASWELDLEAMNLATDQGYENHLLSPRSFLERHGSQLAVINGVDTETNNHDSGQRAMASGRLSDGYPALAALIAARNAPDKPLAFVSGGGYDATGGLVPAARLGNSDALRRIAFPNRINANDADSATYHTEATMARIKAAQGNRLAAIAGAQTLPSLRLATESLVSARLGVDEIARLAVPEPVDLPGGLNDLERMQRSAQLAVSAFSAGLAASASLSLGGFDTHGNHDRDQSVQLAKLLGGVSYLLEELQAAGLADKTTVVVTSDFGRGPYYNGTNDNSGKDHWPVSCVLAVGPGITGDRVVGGTDDDQRALKVDPGSLQLSDGGVSITPGTVHLALRRLAGLDGSESAARFGIAGEALPLFG